VTLADAVRMMAKYQLGRQLTGEETELIVEFLKTLTGELHGKPLAKLMETEHEVHRALETLDALLLESVW
jgi:cytochrome c peroxidase